MKIMIAQIEIIPCGMEKNLKKMINSISNAKDSGCDMIIFPEMCLSGYLIGDMFLKDSFCKDLMSYNEEIKSASSGISVIYGNIYLDENPHKKNEHHPNHDGRTRRYNAVYAFQNTKPVKRVKSIHILPDGIQPKTLLPNYRYFDDKRYFFSLLDLSLDYGVPLGSLAQPFIFEKKNGFLKAGLELCEDLWCKDYRLENSSLNITKMFIENSAELIINISSSPYTFGKNQARDRRVLFLKEECGDNFVPFLYANCVGAQNNGKNILTFDGSSTVYNSSGLPIKISDKPYREDFIVIDNFTSPPVSRSEEKPIECKYNTILEGIRHIKTITGEADPRFVIGLSGGIDSSLVCTLLVNIFGKDNILGLNMPSRFNSSKTINAARKLSQKLGISYAEVSIEELVAINDKVLRLTDPDKKLRPSEFNMENIQAKIRGTSILSNCAAMSGRFFTNNGNKLETALGYATLYGDIGGIISPIGDLTKTEVYSMSKYLNENVFQDEIIPSELFPDELFRFNTDGIAPSAELKSDQIDPMKFGYHCALLTAFTDFNKKGPEDIMNWFLENSLEKNLLISSDLIRRWNIDNPKEFLSDLKWFDSKIQANVFKRVQSPPIIITSRSAYGFDIRESQLPVFETKTFKILREKVMKKKNYFS